MSSGACWFYISKGCRLFYTLADMDNDLDIFVLLGIETSTAQTVILVKVIPRSSYIVYLFFGGGGDFKLIYTTNYTFYTLSYKDQEEGDITYMF